MSILIKNGIIATQNKDREILQKNIYIEDGFIREIGDLNHEADQVIDAGGKVVLPGLINTHCHVAMSLMRGIADDVSFDEFLSRMFKYDANRTREDIYHGAMLGCAEQVLGGVTSFVDLYYHEDEIARAVQEIGMRGFLGWAVLDKEFTTQDGLPLNNCENFIREFRGQKNIYPIVGLQGCYVCSDETFMGAWEIAEKYDTFCHLHLAETRAEVDGHIAKTGKHPVTALAELGFLDKRTLAAHCVWMGPAERKLMREAGASVSHCPVSNSKLSVGNVAPIPQMVEEGINVSLGTDGCVSNNSMSILHDMKFCALLHKTVSNDPAVIPAQKALDFATIDAAKALGMGDSLGSIEVGKKADIVIFDGKVPNFTPLNKRTVVPHIVYSSSQLQLAASIIGGELVYSEGAFAGVDYEEVIGNGRVFAGKLLGQE